MSAIDRCTCIPHYQDAGAGLTEYVPEWDPSCSEHGEVDHILATGQYTDKRGWGWDYVETVASWCSPEIDAEGVSWGHHYLSTAQMRLLIERDQHRDVCVGLVDCAAHPAPAVIACYDYLEWKDFRVRVSGVGMSVHDTLPEAMDAARALAVGT